MRKLFFAISAPLLLALAACNNYQSATNPGGHSPEETAAKIRENEQRKQQQAQQPAEPTAQVASSPVNGQQLYNENCATCHQNGANGAPPLYGIMNRRELPSGTPATDVRVKDTIKMGRANMPAFGRVLNDQQVDAIVAYLHTL